MIKFNQSSDPDYQLNPNRIDIWQYPLHTEFKNASLVLDEDETLRANRYHFPHHQRRFKVARAMMRLLLARYLNSLPKELKFSYAQHGKPELHHATRIEFNLSHSGELALLAIGQDYPLGIDLEFFSARPFEGIGSHLFSENENKTLTAVNERLKPLIFFHTWAQKEAFIKACGLGLSYPTQTFDVIAWPSSEQRIIDGLNNKEWQMTSFMPKAACSAALCHHPQIDTIRYYPLTRLDDL